LPWATEIRNSHHIGDFTMWKDDAAYQQAFMRLLRDLQAQSPRRTIDELVEQ
jgi:hypothetical protein